jgi:hypothetical protein
MLLKGKTTSRQNKHHHLSSFTSLAQLTAHARAEIYYRVPSSVPPDTGPRRHLRFFWKKIPARFFRAGPPNSSQTTVKQPWREPPWSPIPIVLIRRARKGGWLVFLNEGTCKCLLWILTAIGRSSGAQASCWSHCRGLALDYTLFSFSAIWIRIVIVFGARWLWISRW